MVCVSCQNRAYEWRKGKNAKGAFPKLYQGLVRVGVNYTTEGKAHRLEREASGVGELALQLLRDSEVRVVFGMGRGRGAT